MMRVAVYWAPPPDDPLWRAGCTWLGRDPERGADLPQPALPGLHEITAEPRRYGFHATLKPPMRLLDAYDALLEGVRQMAAGIAPFELPALHVADLHGFLALRETAPCPALQTLADGCVTSLDAHRAPPAAADLARRRHAGLSPQQAANLMRWGYPYVLDTWFFHMTLTRRLSGPERGAIRPAAEAHFAGLLQPRRVQAVSLFTQAAPEAPFLIAERVPLG